MLAYHAPYCMQCSSYHGQAVFTVHTLHLLHGAVRRSPFLLSNIHSSTAVFVVFRFFFHKKTAPHRTQGVKKIIFLFWSVDGASN